tara:strand:+ start:17755 stop:18132 length:378 start_codon:yes stop_codon:yes gene_type:complete
MRVYELAKEYEIKATEFVDLIQTFGVDINSHMSGLDEAQIADIRYRMDSKDVDEAEDIPEEVKKNVPSEPDPVEEEEVWIDDSPEYTPEEQEIIEEKLGEVRGKLMSSQKPRGFLGWLISLFGGN